MTDTAQERLDQIIQGVRENLASMARDESLPEKAQLVAGQAWGLIGETCHDWDDGDAEGLVNRLVSALEDAHGVSKTEWTEEVDAAYGDILDRLRARQQEEGEDIREKLRRFVEAQEYLPPEDAELLQENLWRLYQTTDATPQREDGRLVPEACPHCSGLMGHYGDCPHAPQREGEREPDLEAARQEIQQVLDYDDLLMSTEMPLRRAMEALDTEPPAKPDLDELTPRCPVCEETMHDCECNPYMDTEEEGDG